MDVKITLSFDQEVINRAKKFAEANNISLSRLTEFLYSKMINSYNRSLEDLPVADWVDMVAEGKAEYHTRPRSRKVLKKDYYESRK